MDKRSYWFAAVVAGLAVIFVILNMTSNFADTPTDLPREASESASKSVSSESLDSPQSLHSRSAGPPRQQPLQSVSSINSSNDKPHNSGSAHASKFAKYVGEKTAKAIANGGPYTAFHIRSIAHSLKNFEKLLAEMRRRGAEPRQIRRINDIYVELQTHYYAALDQVVPYRPNEEASKRLSQFKRLLESKGADLSDEERNALKRKFLLERQNELARAGAGE